MTNRPGTVGRGLAGAAVLLCLQMIASGQTKPAGKISGSVQTADGKPVAAAVVSVSTRPTGFNSPFQSFEATASAGSDGSYSFGGVPDGTYAVCPAAPDGDLLEPCRWGTETRVSVAGGNFATVPPIKMQHGADLHVRVNDLSGTRAATEGKVAGAGLLLTVRAPNGAIVHIPQTATDKTGADHHVLVPRGTSLVVTAASPSYSVTDGAGKAVARPNGIAIPVDVPANAAQHTQVINIK